MAREVDLNKPESWDNDDKAWLRDRIDRVPEQHRKHLDVTEPMFAPALHAEASEMTRLRGFLELNFPEELNAEGETPVGLAIKLLSDYAGVEDGESGDDDPGYEKWKATELVAEIEKRRENGRDIPGDKFTKAQAAEALRADDTKA